MTRIHFFRFASFLLLGAVDLSIVDALTGPYHPYDSSRGASLEQQASFAYGESCLFGSPGSYSNQNLWAGKKAERQSLGNENDEHSDLTTSMFPQQQRMVGDNDDPFLSGIRPIVSTDEFSTHKP